MFEHARVEHRDPHALAVARFRRAQRKRRGRHRRPHRRAGPPWMRGSPMKLIADDSPTKTWLGARRPGPAGEWRSPADLGDRVEHLARRIERIPRRAREQRHAVGPLLARLPVRQHPCDVGRIAGRGQDLAGPQQERVLRIAVDRDRARVPLLGHLARRRGRGRHREARDDGAIRIRICQRILMFTRAANRTCLGIRLADSWRICAAADGEEGVHGPPTRAGRGGLRTGDDPAGGGRGRPGLESPPLIAERSHPVGGSGVANRRRSACVVQAWELQGCSPRSRPRRYSPAHRRPARRRAATATPTCRRPVCSSRGSASTSARASTTSALPTRAARSIAADVHARSGARAVAAAERRQQRARDRRRRRRAGLRRRRPGGRGPRLRPQRRAARGVADRRGRLVPQRPLGRSGRRRLRHRLLAAGDLARLVGRGGWKIERWLDVAPTITYTPSLTDFDLGGIVSTKDRRSLLTTQGTTGQLWRIDLRSRAIAEVDLGGVRLVNADGIVLRGRTLYVVQNFSRQSASSSSATATERDGARGPADAGRPHLHDRQARRRPAAGRGLQVRLPARRRGGRTGS